MSNITSASRWLCARGETIGAYHRAKGGICQDKTSADSAHGVYAFALADGAGSAILSHLGAQTVTSAVCRLLCDCFGLFFHTDDAGVRQYLLRELLRELQQTAEHHGCAVGDLASTLLAAAVSGDRYLTVHIGDGIIGCVRDGRIQTISPPYNREFCNTTCFVTSWNAAEHLRIQRGQDPSVEGFVLMSDGSGECLYDKVHHDIAPVLGRLTRRLALTSEEYMTDNIRHSLDEVVSAHTRDDCSLLLAARVPDSGQSKESCESGEIFPTHPQSITSA